ncbi:MAG: CobW family GTP-binding protein [Senegalia sp. (in: firmicutes)]|uniref:CobW family GTP-binding protein n=1 Tax=Senegalia sp. (in: firmicutes) TaxID=1924098 RepID=UPI003F9619F8
MTTKIDIISGFLGAGKTTMINKLLEEDALGEGIAIIENEYGDINIDSKRIGQSEIEIKSITSGCICCSLQGEFQTAMKELIDGFKPNRIIIEPTGIGKLSDIISLVNKLKNERDVILNMAIAIVDAVDFEDFIDVFGEFFKDQIQYATTVALSKTQLVKEKKVDEIINCIRNLNPKGNIIATSWDKLSSQNILELAEQNKSQRDDYLENNHHHHTDHQNDEFQYWTMETAKKYDNNRLKEILNRLKENKYGKILRAKGVLSDEESNWMDFDFLPNNIEVKYIKPQAIGKIVLIGKELNKENIDKLFCTKLR